MSAYKYQVNFDKVFVNGAISGLRYEKDYLRFADWHSADEFARSCDGKTVTKACAGSDYIKECPVLTAI